MPNLGKLETKISYKFKDVSLLSQAVTHSSSFFNGRPKKDNPNSQKHYERLEFLGDRVLGLVISEYLMDTFPNEDEGELNLRFAQLVRKESCTLVATKLDLSEFVILGANETKSGLNQNPTILGDVCEALIAALFLDGGMEIAKPFILKNWAPQLKSNISHKQDAKTALQEWAQKLKLALPEYIVSEISGPAHEPTFTIEVNVENHKSYTASGQSKRIAEQKAATEFLTKEDIWTDT
ncbi:MAG: ribonuclease III [Hyphomicrobiales bacterium]